MFGDFLSWMMEHQDTSLQTFETLSGSDGSWWFWVSLSLCGLQLLFDRWEKL